MRNVATIQRPRGCLTLPARPRAQAKPAPALTGTSNHLFVDTVRFWSTLAIVAIHSTSLFPMLRQGSPQLAQAVATPFKFGTIAFFLISGFLLGERIESCRPAVYLRKRLQKVFLPWLFWFALLVAFFLTANVLRHQVALAFNVDTLNLVGRKIVSCLFTTAFWFVPNLLLSLTVLLVFRRRLHDLRFGAALLLINLFYVANIYRRWLPSSHTEAMLGFVFYLWLGTCAARHFSRLHGWISRVPLVALLGASLLTALFAFLEARLLGRLGSPDPMNSLRLSNQIFSVTIALLLMKFRRPTWPRFVHVRSNTFGLYLTHTLVLSIVLHAMVRLLSRTSNIWLGNSDPALVGLWLITVVTTYGACLIVTRAIHARPGLRWLIGSSTPRPQPQTPPRLATVLEMPALRSF